MTISPMRARAMTPDGKWYCWAGPTIHVIYYDYQREADLNGQLSFMTDRDWCYHAECDLIIFAHLFGDVVSEKQQQDSDDEEDSDVVMSTDEKKEDDYYNRGEESGEESFNRNENKKKELDDVTSWPKVFQRMQAARWGFTPAELQAYWKETVVPKLRAIRETRARRGLKDQNNTKYHALAGLAAACHKRNVDPADHPHGYGKPMPTSTEMYLERICTEFGGKSAEVICEQEEALKQSLQLKKAKRGGNIN